jgi:hypothetical protein
MNQFIYIPPTVLIGKDLSERIAEHNHHIERVWMLKGSACKPFTPSTVPAPMPDLSRVRMAAEHGGAALKVRS